MNESKIRELCQAAAVRVGKNAGVAPQLCFPHIYLTFQQPLAELPEELPKRSTIDSPAFRGLLTDWWAKAASEDTDGAASALRVLVQHIDQERAADAPSEPSELVFAESDGVPFRHLEYGDGLFFTLNAGKSRAADALDSQPTDQETRDRIRNAIVTCGHAIEDKSVKLFRDPKFPGGALSQLIDRIVLAISGFSSQPTDGGVCNGRAELAKLLAGAEPGDAT